MGKIVDLSHHQGKIDFAKFSKEADLAIIRVQYGSSTIDKEYKNYVAGCKKYSVPFGHYAYARFTSIADAKAEANDFLTRVDKEAKFLVVDVEELTTSKSQVVQATQAFIDVCKKAGFKTGLYTGHHFYEPYSMDKVKADFLWIPRYQSKDDGKIHSVRPDMKCDLWQYTQCGKIAGVAGYVDVNVLNGTKALSYFTGNKKVPVSKSKLVPKPVLKASSNTIKKIGTIQIVNVSDACYIVDRPSNNAKNLGTAKKGSKLPIAGSVDGWFEVIYEGKRAYVNVKYGKLL